MSLNSFQHILANIQEETNQKAPTSSQPKECQKIDPCIVIENLNNCKEILFSGIFCIAYICLVIMFGLLYLYKDEMKKKRRNGIHKKWIN